MNVQHEKSFGGRLLTQDEYNAFLRCEKKRSRWFAFCVLLLVLILLCGMIGLVNHLCENRLEKAHLRALGFDPRHDKANYNAFCMIEYHNFLHGTDYDAFWFDDGGNVRISRELEMEMLEAYYVHFLHAPVDERPDFVPTYTMEEFQQRIRQLADEAMARVEPPYNRVKQLCLAIAAGVLLFAGVMLALTAGKHTHARQLSCRRGVMHIPLDALLQVLKPRMPAQVEAADALGPEYEGCIRVSRWRLPPAEAWKLLKVHELPVMLVMADDRLTYYPLAPENETVSA